MIRLDFPCEGEQELNLLINRNYISTEWLLIALIESAGQRSRMSCQFRV